MAMLQAHDRLQDYATFPLGLPPGALLRLKFGYTSLRTMTRLVHAMWAAGQSEMAAELALTFLFNPPRWTFQQIGKRIQNKH
jgi:hypothetical protein